MILLSRKIFNLSVLPLLTICFYTTICAQKTLNSYQELSHLFYARQVDSIKKAWICPNTYTQKETQKKFKELWDDRTSFLASTIENRSYVHETEVYEYISAIVTEIVNANKIQIPKPPMVLLDRSAAVNAYAMGNNTVAINMGLIYFSNTREELALIIAHELAHNILEHANNAIKEKAELLTSETYKNAVNAVLDSKYERLTRLKKIIEGYSFNRTKHNRYHESEADSLAIVLLKNAQIPFEAKYFLRLDSVDVQFKKPLKTPVKQFFADYGLAVDDTWLQKKSKGLSTRNYNFKDTSGIADSLKTHPDCQQRYLNTLAYSDAPGKRTSIPLNIKNKVSKLIIWNLFDDLKVTPCLYLIFKEKDEGNTDPWYDFMVHNIITGLYYSDKLMNRFNAINIISKEYISKDYYELQTLLEQIPREQLATYCKILKEAPFWKNMPDDAVALKTLMHEITFESGENENAKSDAAKAYRLKFPNSTYMEFAQHFIIEKQQLK